MVEHYRVLKGGLLIDGNGKAIENSILVMKGDKIEEIGTGETITIPEEADVIDTTSKTVMPGLIEAHVHLYGMKSMNLMDYFVEPPELRAIRVTMGMWKLIDSGFTTARECGSPNGLFLKTAVEERSIIGPRLLACGGVISQTGGEGDYLPHSIPIEWIKQRGPTKIADGVEECRSIVREQLREGADFVKIVSSGGVWSEKDQPTTSRYTLDEIRVIVEEAHNAGAKVASLIQGSQQWIKDLVSAGVDSLEHGIYLEDEVIEMIAEKGTYLMPTLAIAEAISSKGSSSGLPEAMVSRIREAHDGVQRRSFKKAWKAGIKIGCGSNYAYDPFAPMGENAVELKLHGMAGRSPMEVIISATKINAEALGIDDKLGTLEAGKLADVIIVNGNPIKNISILCDKENIEKIYKSGEEVPRLK